MTDFTCEVCDSDEGDVRRVEHGTDDIRMCKPCFLSLADALRRGGTHLDDFQQHRAQQ